MKKVIVSFLIIISTIGLFTSCGKSYESQAIKFSFNDNGNYTGFANLPVEYSIEEAEKDGYFVAQDLEDDINKKLWDNFSQDAAKGENAGIRIVSFDTEDNSIAYFSDLFLNDGYYYLFDSSSENQEKQPYQYLLTLEGKFGNPLRDSGVVVLTDDNTLTFDHVMKSMLSSNMDYKKNISPYQLVMFQ